VKSQSERIMELERQVADLQSLMRAGARQAQVSLAGLGRRLERCIITESAGPDSAATAKLINQDDEEFEHREIEVWNTNELYPLIEDAKVDIAWRQLPGERKGKWIPISPVGPRLIRVTLSEDLDIAGEADANGVGSDDGEYVIHDRDRWPIRNGTQVTAIGVWDDAEEEVRWYPISAERTSQELLTNLCCDNDELKSCKVSLAIDSMVDEEDCDCEPSAARSSQSLAGNTTNDPPDNTGFFNLGNGTGGGGFFG